MGRRITKKLNVVVVVVVVVVLAAVGVGAGCSSNGTTVSSTTTEAQLDRPFAVGRVTETLVDSSRMTPANGEPPAKDDRTIETSICYPAEGDPSGKTIDDAPADGRGAPFPLVVLGHGLGGNEEYLTPLAQSWV